LFTSTTGRAPRLIPGTRLRRIIAALAVAASGVLAWAAIPAASAAIIPVPAEGGGYGPAGGTSAAIPVPAIATGGMPGWQITLIAVAAALAAAAASVFLDRVRANRRTASTTG
jgi:hypothetical protein